MEKRRTRGPLGPLIDLLASTGLACVLLACLFVLVFVSTFEQEKLGLWEVKRQYFQAWWVRLDVARWSVPFPAGMTCMGLLAVNLILGGLLRLRWRASVLGIAICHLGIVMLLVAGFVELKRADEGFLQVVEGEQSTEFVDYHHWELAIWDSSQTEEVQEWLVPHATLRALTGDGERVFEHEDLPFELRLSGFLRNCWPHRAGEETQGFGPAVDGVVLEDLPLDAEDQRNLAGVRVSVVADGASGAAQEGLLWSAELWPWVVEADGRQWAITLRNRRHSLPFAVRLDDFTKLDYAGIDKARSFESEVTILEGEDEQRALIRMNEPLRRGGHALYQHNWGPQDPRDPSPTYSVFSVSRNPSDKWPEWATYVIGLGLLLAFGEKLLKYIRSQARSRRSRAQA